MKTLKVLFALMFIVGCADFNNSSKKINPAKNQSPTDVAERTGSAMDPNFDPRQGEFTETKMVANIGLNIIQPLAKSFRLQTEVLAARIGELCEDVSNEGVEDQALRQWQEAMMTFHRLAAVPLGPLSSVQADLQNRIYSWPYTSPCGIDIQVERVSRLGKPEERRINSVQGLSALEYLLFEKELGTQCNPSNVSLKPVQDWVKKSKAAKKKDRCQYSQILVSELIPLAKQIEDNWDRNKLNYTQVLISGSEFPKISDAVNAISDALFSIEKVKDQDLGKPLGFHKECLEASGKCENSVNHLWSQKSFEAIDVYMQTFQRVFFGGSIQDSQAFGFDDALNKLGRGDVVERVQITLQKIKLSLETSKKKGSLRQQILEMDLAQCKATTEQSRQVEVCALFQEIRELNIILKTEVLVALSLKAPPVYQGDND